MVKLADGAQAQQKKATRAAYGATLAELASEGVPVVAVDADLTGSTTTKKLADAGFADRLFNCGIAEQNMVDVAAGLAITGHVAFTGSFAVFGTGRAYDQIRNTVCYSNLDVKIAPTHAGISVGPDGGSHQMLEDVSLMRGLPNMRVLVPADYAAARAALRLAAATPGPVYVRMGRASVPCVYADDVELELGRAYVLREGGAGVQGRVRYSDDGEPQKTAGLPTLEVIQHAGLTDVITVVTRYFGGVLLGTGGLVRAYTQATQAGIEAAELVVVSRCVDIEVRAAYGKYDQLVRIASDCGAKVLDTVYDDAVTLRLRMLDGTQEPLLLKITELERGQERVRVSEPLEAAF